MLTSAVKHHDKAIRKAELRPSRVLSNRGDEHVALSLPMHRGFPAVCGVRISRWDWDSPANDSPAHVRVYVVRETSS